MKKKKAWSLENSSFGNSHLFDILTWLQNLWNFRQRWKWFPTRPYLLQLEAWWRKRSSLRFEPRFHVGHSAGPSFRLGGSGRQSLCQYRCLLQAPSARHPQISFDRRVRLDEYAVYYILFIIRRQHKTHTHTRNDRAPKVIDGKEK